MEYEVVKEYKKDGYTIRVKRKMLQDTEKDQDYERIAKQLKHIIQEHKQRVDMRSDT